MPMTHRRRKRLPKPRAIAMIWRALLATVPMDVPPRHGIRESYRGVINYRIACFTAEREWFVDVYTDEFFLVTCRGYTQVCPSVPSTIGHLRRMLGLKDVIHRRGTQARP